MLLIDVHQFDVVLAEPVGVRTLENQVHDIWGVFGLECEDIIALSCAEHFCEGAQIDAESDVAIAAEGCEHLSLQHHRNERNVGVVHSLEGNAGVITVEVAVLDQIFDRIDYLGSVSGHQYTYWACEPSSRRQTARGVLLTLYLCQ